MSRSFVGCTSRNKTTCGDRCCDTILLLLLLSFLRGGGGAAAAAIVGVSRSPDDKDDDDEEREPLTIIFREPATARRCRAENEEVKSN